MANRIYTAVETNLVLKLLKNNTPKRQIARDVGVARSFVDKMELQLLNTPKNVVGDDDVSKVQPKEIVATDTTQQKQQPVVDTTSKPKFKYRCMMSDVSITITKINPDDPSESRTECLRDSHPDFQMFFDKLLSSRLKDQSIIEDAFDAACPKLALVKFSFGHLVIDPQSGEITFGNHKVDTEMSNIIVRRLRETQDISTVESLLRFLDKLVMNPSYRAVKELYGFLMHNDIKFTDDGYFLAYKRVRSNYFDIHSNTFDNSVGKVLSVPRNLVDEDSDRTCSHGLHVCSRDYLQHFSSSGSNDKILVVKVDPADVVAIPKDYNNTKMRCCGYEVIKDISDEYFGRTSSTTTPESMFDPDYDHEDQN